MKHLPIAIALLFLSCGEPPGERPRREAAALALVARVGEVVSMKCSHGGGCSKQSSCVAVIHNVGVFSIDCGGTQCTVVSMLPRKFEAEQ